jgi:hypothetical protein
MKVKLYAVLDSASAVYDGPVPCKTDSLALRNFVNMGKNPDSAIFKNPECFSLWRVGEYDDAKGEVTSVTKECLGYAVDLGDVDNA